MAKAKAKTRDPDPAQELERLAADLESGELAPAYLFRGEERYFREQGARLVVAAATGRGLEVCSHDALDPEFDLPLVLDDLVSGALFATARCVVVQRADLLLKKGGRRYAAGFEKALLARLAAEGEGITVLGAEGLRADNVVVKATLAAGGRPVGCRRLWETAPPWAPDPRRAELVQWLARRARELGVELGLDDAALVAAATGNDLYALESKLETLRGRGGTVAEGLAWESGGSPYPVAEALARGDARSAVTGIETLFRGGFQGRDGGRTVDRAGIVVMLLAALTGKIREALAGAAAVAEGADPRSAAAAAGVRGGPRALQELEARLAARPLEDWRRLLFEVGDLDRRSRSGATVDANDFVHLALRWSGRHRSGSRVGARPHGR